MKKKNNVMMVATIAITLLMIGCVVVMGIIQNSNRNNPDVKPPEQTTDTTDTNQEARTESHPDGCSSHKTESCISRLGDRQHIEVCCLRSRRNLYCRGGCNALRSLAGEKL